MRYGETTSAMSRLHATDMARRKAEALRLDVGVLDRLFESDRLERGEISALMTARRVLIEKWAYLTGKRENEFDEIVGAEEYHTAQDRAIDNEPSSDGYDRDLSTVTRWEDD